MLSIKEQIKTGKLNRFQLIYGEERYMIRYYKKNIIKCLQMEEDEMNCSFYEGSGIDVYSLVDAAQTLPFFADCRLLVIENSGFFKSANDLTDYLDDLPETTYLLFVEKEVDKRNRLYKYIQRNGCLTEAKAESEQTLIQWVAAYFKSAGKSVTKNTVLFFLNKVGTNMELLIMEMEKLISYAYNKDVIEVSDIEMICTQQMASRIFEMVDAVAEGNQRRAMLLYNDLLALKEPPTRILYLFIRHVNQMLQVKEEEKRQISGSEIAKKVGVPPFAVRKLSQQARYFSREQLIQMLVQGTKFEEAVKTGNLTDQLAVELFITRYTK